MGIPTWGGHDVSGDGRYVAFDSHADNLVSGDTNGASDVFVHDRQTRVTERVSVASDGTWAGAGEAPQKDSWQPAISADDPADDAAPGVQEAGAELTGASLTYRHEQEDLLVGLRLASLPGERCTVVASLGCL